MWAVFPFFGGTLPKRKRRNRVSPNGVLRGAGFPIVPGVCLLGIIVQLKLMPQFLSRIQQSNIFKIILNMEFVENGEAKSFREEGL